jgi:hypothetical protein
MNVLPLRGLKHTCSSCHTRFYDLNKIPAACPTCHLRVPAVKVRAPRKRRVGQGDTALAPGMLVAAPKPIKKMRWG